MREHKSAESDEKLLTHLSTLPAKDQEHFKLLVRLISRCYGKDARASGVLIVRDNERLAVLSVNANDIDMAEIIMCAAEATGSVLMEDAPPKEMFN
jgi:hypothetical protein